MNLFDRFTRVAKSNLNNILKNLEDPEKIMNQAVEDMQVRNISYRLWFGVIIFTHIIIRNNLLSIFDFISPS
jgi:phage shock protein A